MFNLGALHLLIILLLFKSIVTPIGLDVLCPVGQSMDTLSGSALLLSHGKLKTKLPCPGRPLKQSIRLWLVPPER